MKNRIRILWLVMSALIFSGCGGKAEIAPSQPPGTLAAIDYSRTVGMVWGENFSVRVSPEEIVYIEFFVENDSEYRIETGIPLEEDRWQQLETAVLALWPDLTEVRPEKESLWKRFFKKEEPFLLDGGDSSSLTLEQGETCESKREKSRIELGFKVAASERMPLFLNMFFSFIV